MTSVAPNAVAVKQQLLEGFGSYDSPYSRGGVKVGILNVLAVFDQLPFWYTLFHELGFSLVVVHGTPGGGGVAGLETIPSESVCYPAKQAHSRLYALAQQGATHVFFPQYDRLSRCAVNCGYVCILQDYVPLLKKGSLCLVAPLLVARRARKLIKNKADVDAVYQAVQSLDPAHPVHLFEFDEALQQAAAVQDAFDRAIEQANGEAAAWAARPGNHGIVLAGRPYHADPALLHGLDQEVAALGMSVLCGTNVAGPKPADDGVPPWKPAKHLVKLAHQVADNPSLDLVCLQAFGCGYDALNMPEVKVVLGQAGKAFTVLQLDDVMNNAQSRIRLRTLAYAAKSGRRHPASFVPAAVDPLDGTYVELARAEDPGAFNNLERADVDAVFGGYPDLCFVAQALAGRAVRLVATAVMQGQPLERLAVPYVCKYCMLDALPRMVWRTLGYTPAVDWVDYRPSVAPADLAGCRPAASANPAPASPAPASPAPASPASANQQGAGLDPANLAPANLAPASPAPASPAAKPVGIMGVAPLVYDGYLNDHLREFLAPLGFAPLLPDQEYLVDEDMSYPAARAFFESQGVTKVLYLNSFRCLKGHIDAHGALKRMGRENPSLKVTVIDYDSESSVLNRQNRIVLAITL